MILTLMLALVASAPAAPRSTAVRADDPPIHVWLNSDNTFLSGDRARVHFRAAHDGYVVVLRADADGHVRVLFPLDPGADDFVRGGDKREIRSRGDREAFVVDEREGTGVVLAAWSASAFTFDQFVRGDHWDYRALDTRQSGGGGGGGDAEAALVDLVQTMAGQNHFDYDVVTYTVGAVTAYRYYRPYYGGYGWGWPHRRFLFGIGYGYPYYGGFGCDPFWGGFGCGFYDPFYEPFVYSGYYYRPYRPFGYTFVGGRSYYGSYGGGGLLLARARNGLGVVQPRSRLPLLTSSGTLVSRSTGTRLSNPSFTSTRSAQVVDGGPTRSSSRTSSETWSGRSRASASTGSGGGGSGWVSGSRGGGGG